MHAHTRFLLALPLVLIACNNMQPGSRTKEIGEKAEKQAGRIAQKMAGAVDKALQKENFELRAKQTMAEFGLQATRALRMKVPQDAHGITIYLIANKAFSGTLELRALDSKNLEVGRARTILKQEAGSARFVDFTLDPRTPLDEVDAVELRVTH